MKRLVLALSAIVTGVVVSSCAVGVRGPAISITPTSATLTGTVLSTSGGAGNYYIQYDGVNAPPGRTPTRTINFEASKIYPVLEQVDDLKPGHIYRFAVCAEDDEHLNFPFCSREQTFQAGFVPGTDYVSWNVTGENCAGGRCSATETTVLAISGPSGENLTGFFSFTVGGSQLFSGQLTCFRANGNQAVLGLDISAPGAEHSVLYFEDAATDRFGVVNTEQSVTSCPPFASELAPATTTGVLIHDAPAADDS